MKEWKKNIIIPIHKKGSKTECDNYRAICLSSTVLKVYTRVLECRLREIVEPELEEEQCAFRPGRQTHDHIYSIRTIIEKTTQRGKDLFLAFLDLQAAFDTVPHATIWKALEKKNVPPRLTEAIKSTFSNITGIVRTNGKESQPFRMASGIKQGDSLSPLLFIIVMDEVHKICRLRTGLTKVGNWNMRHIYAQALLFADDILLIADTEGKLQNMVDEWTRTIEG